jgi:putative membrane protein
MRPEAAKELILQEKLSLQRTTLANQATFLSFLRTSMYFLVAGLSVQNLLKLENGLYIQIGLFFMSALILTLGIINYYVHKKKIKRNQKNVGAYHKDLVKEMDYHSSDRFE